MLLVECCEYGRRNLDALKFWRTKFLRLIRGDLDWLCGCGLLLGVLHLRALQLLLRLLLLLLPEPFC